MRVIILAGCSGSGKTRYAKLLQETNRPGVVAIVSADKHFTDAVGNYEFKKEFLGRAHNECLLLYAKILYDCFYNPHPENPKILVVDNTNTTEWEIAPYARLAEAYGCDVDIIAFISTDEPTCAKRNSHGVPLETVMNQKKRLKQMLVMCGMNPLTPCDEFVSHGRTLFLHNRIPIICK
jgi:predicted kinase